MTKLYGSDEARELQRKYPAIDLHVHTLLWAGLIGFNPAVRHNLGMIPGIFRRRTDLPRAADGLVGAQFQALASMPLRGPLYGPKAVNLQLEKFDSLIAEYPNLVTAVRTAEGIEQANRDGKIVQLLGIEGAHALDGKISEIERFAKRGIRYICMAHFTRNQVCTPSVGPAADFRQGLTPFGREAIEACEANGVIVDLAHINYRGFFEACFMAKKPVLVSHTGVAGVHDHDRNIDDVQLRAVAETGGLVGLTFVGWIIGGSGIAQAVRHLNHIVNVVGEDHVAIGSDLDSPVTMLPELSDVSMMPNLTEALLADGWSEGRIAKLLRLNVLRLLRDAPPVHLHP